jgi:hypothetical protein
LNRLNSGVLAFVNGDVKRKVLIPIRMMDSEASKGIQAVKQNDAVSQFTTHSGV